ncbi:MAG: LytTR family DNA-binding domain-containing protein [Bacteroidales bacterium]|nr:LytTR family DNA-binding domain-containing protein [Bacteroidales bacterium]
MKKNLPKYLTEKDTLFKTIVFTAIFSLIFINLYLPFSSKSWYGVSDFTFLIGTTVLVITGAIVLGFSRVLMFYFVKKHPIILWQYALWITIEVLVISSIFSFYSWKAGQILDVESERNLYEICKTSFLNTLLIMMLPYTVLWLYFSLQDKKNRLQKIEEMYGAEKNVDKGEKNSIIAFRDEKGVLRFSVVSENLIYLESADNYVVIVYINKGVLSKFMIRNSLKRIEESLANTKIKRCHRSYMVNFEHIKILRREKDGIHIEFNIPNVPQIHISKTYTDEITEWFLSYSDRNNELIVS